MPVAPFGLPIDYTAWAQFADSSGIALVFDSAAAFDTGGGFHIAKPDRLFDATEVPTMLGEYDVLPNGDFIMVELAAWEKKPACIHVVTNWAATLGKDSTP